MLMVLFLSFFIVLDLLAFVDVFLQRHFFCSDFHIRFAQLWICYLVSEVPSLCCLSLLSHMSSPFSIQALVTLSHRSSRGCLSSYQMWILLCWSGELLLFSQLALHSHCILHCFLLMFVVAKTANLTVCAPTPYKSLFSYILYLNIIHLCFLSLTGLTCLCFCFFFFWKCGPLWVLSWVHETGGHERMPCR